MIHVGQSIFKEHLFFEDLTLDEIAILEKASSIKEIQKRQFLKLEGESCNYIYLLVNGTIKKGQYSYYGQEYSSCIIRSNQVFGLLSIANSNKNCFYQAFEKSTVLCIKKNEFETVLKNNAQFGFKVLSTIACKTTKIENNYFNMAFNGVKGRVAYFLISLANNIGQKIGNEIVIEHKLTQREMANFIGLSRQTVNGAIKSFKKENIIALLDRDKILIRDIGLLKEYQHTKKRNYE